MTAAVASYWGAGQWLTIAVALGHRSPGVRERSYWEAEVARLRASHPELSEAHAFVVRPLDRGLTKT